MRGHPDLDALRRRAAAPLVTRFAPSPTGYLHLGHVVNAIYVWGVARAIGAAVRVRLEDHDRLRSRPRFVEAILEDLVWLGFLPAGASVRRQSEQDTPYVAALDALRTTSQVYGCACSRRDLGDGPYDGRCRTRGLAGEGLGLRVVIPPDAVTADDVRLGPLRQHPAAQCGDVLVRDRDGHWTYQFAVTVDDIADGVTLVVRGEDLVDSTGRQILLRRLLGHPDPPLYLHHPLVLGPDGRKLSKAEGATGIRELRERGTSAPDVIGRAAAAAGLLDAPRPVAASEVHTLFLG